MKSIKNEVYRTYEGITHWSPSANSCNTGHCWCNPSWGMIESRMTLITDTIGAPSRL